MTTDIYKLVPNKEKIEELKNELGKYGKVVIYKSPAEHISEIHLIVKVPYKKVSYKSEFDFDYEDLKEWLEEY